MAHAKDKHYWSQLRAALTAGQWTSSSPAKNFSGCPLPWSELFRKFNKHCKGFQDVAKIAFQTHALSELLGVNATNEDQLGSEPDNEFRLGDECILLPEQIETATGGYETLKKLESRHSDSLALALAYYAYALGQPSECLTHLSRVPQLLDAQSHIPVSSTTRSDASALQVPGSTTDMSSSWTGSFLSAESSASITDIKDGRAWAMTESIRSVCLQGMCHEKLDPSIPEKAIQAYSTSMPLLNIVEFEIPRTLTAQSLPSSFTHYRELWRWVERLMFRAITLLARVRHLDDQEGLIWNFFTHYESCSAHWPPTFRTAHRSIVAVLHLRALVIRFRAASGVVTPTSSLQYERPPQWLSTARSIINEYRTILDKCTHFPKAGDRNVPVEDLVDLSVAVWEASGAMSDRAHWVIDILWWATRLTFNSYRIFRHVTRLLYISGDAKLAKRTLRLYVQVVSKTREAGVDGDHDTDHHWVGTLVEGARMLCRLALSRPGSDGVDEVKEAGELIEKAKTRLNLADKELVARVALAEGVWNTVTALTDCPTRATQLSNALMHYIKSVETFPTPDAHHQLALALALAGPSQNLEEAITCARAAVEGAPDEIRHWHLLALLLTAQGQWAKAKGTLEFGARIGEASLETEEHSSDVEATQEKSAQEESFPNNDGVTARDFEGEITRTNGSAPNGNGQIANGILVHEMILDPDAITIPPSATLLQPLPDHPSPSPRDAFEYALQLRLTQMALTEHVEGPEGAEGKWVGVFGWIAERKGSVSETQLRSSMDTGSRSVATQTSSAVLVPVHETEAELHGSLEPKSAQTNANGTTSQLPPITVTPATPAEPDRRFPASADPQEKIKRSFSMDRDSSTGRRMQQMLKNRVHKGQEKISTISKKIGHGVVRNGSLHLRRTTSAPDFHAVLQNHNYQASSIHSRSRLRSLIHHNNETGTVVDNYPLPLPPPGLPPVQETALPDVSREDRLLSDLWAASAATFRRLGKIDQAKGAIQEAEVKNQANPAVWVQLGLYHKALNHDRQAIEAFQKALFIFPDDVSAAVHMCRIYLSPGSSQSSETGVDPDKVDLSVGLLGYLTRGPGWDVPEAWYYLAKAHGLRGQKDEERECLTKALTLSEKRCIRDIGSAVGWCL
ncbi:TPR-like protein [Gyrodon lividus]|nr:TPR-like protein [Gyrodon lividus]